MGSNKKVVLKLNFDEEKMKALRVIFQEKNKDVEAEIGKYLESLYQKNVPKVLKMFVEKEENSEENKA